MSCTIPSQRPSFPSLYNPLLEQWRDKCSQDPRVVYLYHSGGVYAACFHSWMCNLPQKKQTSSDLLSIGPYSSIYLYSVYLACGRFWFTFYLRDGEGLPTTMEQLFIAYPPPRGIMLRTHIRHLGTLLLPPLLSPPVHTIQARMYGARPKLAHREFPDPQRHRFQLPYHPLRERGSGTRGHLRSVCDTFVRSPSVQTFLMKAFRITKLHPLHYRLRLLRLRSRSHIYQRRGLPHPSSP